MNILMAADKGALSGVELVVYSTMAHNKNVNWYIFTMTISCPIEGQQRSFLELDKDDEAWLKKIVKYHDSNSNLKVINVAEWYAKYLENNPNRESAFTPFTTLRLLADLVLPNVHDLLYLDCDVVVQKSLEDMYYGYLKNGKPYYAYSIPEACDWESEMVAGVLLFDLNKIREIGFLAKARENINKHVYKFPDQMALRDAGDPYPLQETYNYMFSLWKCSYTPHIIHFTNEIGGKIYHDGKTVFYRKFSQFKYIEDGLNLIKSI